MLNQTFCIFTKIDAHRATKFYSWKNDHFFCGSSFPDKVVGSKRKKKLKKSVELKQKLNHVLLKARQKIKECCTVGKGSDEGKNKQKCFSSMSMTHSAFSRKGSKPKSAG